jgi:hypothetical protein
MRKILLLSFLLTLQLMSFAHQDTTIELSQDGTLVGLPGNYSNAKFDIETFTLSINNKQIVVPDCVKEYFINYENYNIRFAASWYHDPDLLPNYIHMDIITPENPNGCQIFFNLDTLEIFQIAMPEVVRKDGANLYLFNEQYIGDECQTAILNSIIVW